MSTSGGDDDVVGGKRQREASCSPNSDKKKRQKGTKYVCPICTEAIKETTQRRSGDDAIFCESTCNSWLHRQCAGLSKAAFDVLSVSESPFYCPHCRLQRYESQLSDLKDSVKLLENKVTELEAGLKSLDSVKEIQTNDGSEGVKGNNAVAALNPVPPTFFFLRLGNLVIYVHTHTVHTRIIMVLYK